MRYRILIIISLSIFISGCLNKAEVDFNLYPSPHDMVFKELPKVWDEGIPLGNGMIGALIWQDGDELRLSLDRADLWDLRPMENLGVPEMKYKWVYEQWKKDDYKPVQDKFDVPYDRSPAPSKIPGAALTFDISPLGPVKEVRLFIKQAVCQIEWLNGIKMKLFVHANDPVGWFEFEGLDKLPNYNLIPPAYNLLGADEADSPVTGQDLRRLGYPNGKITKDKAGISYMQEGWGGFKYEVSVAEYKPIDEHVGGIWSISSSFTGWKEMPSSKENIASGLQMGIIGHYQNHLSWWDKFWSKSSIKIPDEILEKQWYLEQYKFGAAARVGAPPISLQAVWTADNGKLPPWKGDFHHDLNTQLSYWPAYSGNHLAEEQGFIDWLWKHKNTFEEYTKGYYDVDGINVPGVSTLTGQPMGGWIQYAFGPTVSAWLGQHFYWHWKYSMDPEFLETRAYPWIKGVAQFLEGISIKNEQGYYQLPISSSPEIHNNSRDAWYGETTNFDLALIRYTFEKAAELANALTLTEEAAHWTNILNAWPEFAIDESGLKFAPTEGYTSSHRHFSHQMPYHPMGLVDYANGPEDIKVINNTIKTLDSIGSDYWTGYSFSWFGGLKARAFDGEGAAEALLKFATAFCLPNSFHANGDQSGKGYSKFTYRPFTLEGNFAFAAAIQEMLIQSHTGIVHIFPAIPKKWQDISFKQLRTEGAFLISAKQVGGKVVEVKIQSEMGGILQLLNPFGESGFKVNGKSITEEDQILEIPMKAKETVILTNK